MNFDYSRFGQESNQEQYPSFMVEIVGVVPQPRFNRFVKLGNDPDNPSGEVVHTGATCPPEVEYDTVYEAVTIQWKPIENGKVINRTVSTFTHKGVFSLQLSSYLNTHAQLNFSVRDRGEEWESERLQALKDEQLARRVEDETVAFKEKTGKAPTKAQSDEITDKVISELRKQAKADRMVMNLRRAEIDINTSKEALIAQYAEKLGVSGMASIL